jgi:mannose-6-phosphate isomerase class I
LPKTLDVAELLSVQAHPAGNVEAYVVIDADPGATLHLGFARDVDRAALASRMQDGIACQRRLETMLDANAIQTALRPLLQSREPAMAAVLDPLSPRLRADVDRGELERVLVELAATYWYVLEQLNRVEVRPGQVIFNATPERLSSAGPSCAEVHALGNSDGKEMLILEIRRPGITLRAWDHVRFPMREVAVEPALDAMGLAATTPDDFEVIASPLAGQPGVWRSVVCPMFTMDHLRPRPGADVAIDAQAPHTLHCIAGGAAIVARHGSTALGRGESALIGARLGSYRVRSEATDTEVVKVTLGA